MSIIGRKELIGSRTNYLNTNPQIVVKHANFIHVAVADEEVFKVGFYPGVTGALLGTLEVGIRDITDGYVGAPLISSAIASSVISGDEAYAEALLSPAVALTEGKT